MNLRKQTVSSFFFIFTANIYVQIKHKFLGEGKHPEETNVGTVWLFKMG